MGIGLGGGDLAMPQKIFHLFEGHAGLQKVRGDRMAQVVATYYMGDP